MTTLYSVQFLHFKYNKAKKKEKSKEHLQFKVTAKSAL